MTTSWSDLPRHEPEVRTIAHYKREYAVLTAGAIIAASSEYVGYALRGAAPTSAHSHGARATRRDRLNVCARLIASQED